MESTNYTEVSIDDEDMEYSRSKFQIVCAATFLFITIIFGLLGNMAVIAVVCIQKSMHHETSNMLIINLCVTDLSNSILVMITAFIALVSDEWIMGRIWCDCVCAINYCLIIVSMLTLCCISLDRYQAVTNPLSYKVKITRKHMIIAIIFTWVQGITFGCAPSVSGWIAFDYWEGICAIQWHLYQPDSIVYVVLAFLFCFLIPGMILVYCYAKILKEVKKQKYQVKINISGDSKTIERNRKKVSERSKIVWSLLVVVLAYFICTTPFSVTKLIKVIVNDKNFIPGPINLTASLLGYVASAINPLIYGIFRRDFRNAYKQLLCSVFFGRKNPGFLETNSTSGIQGTITNANINTNQDTNNITGLETALNELQLSQGESKKNTGQKSAEMNEFFENGTDNVNGNGSVPHFTVDDKMEILTIPEQYNEIHNGKQKKRNSSGAAEELNRIQKDTDEAGAKSSTISIASCRQIKVKSVFSKY